MKILLGVVGEWKKQLMWNFKRAYLYMSYISYITLQMLSYFSQLTEPPIQLVVFATFPYLWSVGALPSPVIPCRTNAGLSCLRGVLEVFIHFVCRKSYYMWNWGEIICMIHVWVTLYLYGPWIHVCLMLVALCCSGEWGALGSRPSTGGWCKTWASQIWRSRRSVMLIL